MRLLSEVLLSPVSGPTRMIGFVVKRIKDQVEAEYLDEGKVQAELLDLTLRYDRGEIDDAEYKEHETLILQHLNDIRAYKEATESEQDVAASEESEE